MACCINVSTLKVVDAAAEGFSILPGFLSTYPVGYQERNIKICDHLCGFCFPFTSVSFHFVCFAALLVGAYMFRAVICA